MSYPVQQIDRASLENSSDGGVFQSFLGLANQMMNDMIRNGPMTDSMTTSFSDIDSKHPGVKIFGISSTNVTEISRGPDGRPHIVQAQDERRMGPGGVWQTKKTLRDPERGIDKMQVGYFVGNRGEIVERHRDPASGQYRQEIKHRGVASNDPNFSTQWKTQAHQAMQRPGSLSSQQQLSYHDPHPQ